MIKSKLVAAIDAGIPLLAGGSAAFVLFAMPEPLLARIFTATHLAPLSRALQSPIGNTARLSIAIGAGLLAFAFVWSLFKALDRPSAGTREAVAPAAAPDPEAPRLRRADAHPDAPARRPLIAGRDLGEPLELDQPIAEEAAEDFVPVPETAPLPAFLVPQPESEPALEPEPEPLASAAPPEPQPAEARAPVEEESASDESIVSLMRRFETGLSRKKQALPAPGEAPPPAQAVAPALPQPPEPVAGPAPVGHRLRGAIADLQRAAGH